MKTTTEFLTEVNQEGKEITRELLNEIWKRCFKLSYTKHVYSNILNYLNNLVKEDIITSEQSNNIYDFICNRLRCCH